MFSGAEIGSNQGTPRTGNPAFHETGTRGERGVKAGREPVSPRAENRSSSRSNGLLAAHPQRANPEKRCFESPVSCPPIPESGPRHKSPKVQAQSSGSKPAQAEINALAGSSLMRARSARIDACAMATQSRRTETLVQIKSSVNGFSQYFSTCYQTNT